MALQMKIKFLIFIWSAMCSETIYRFYGAKVKTSICVVASREKLEAENQKMTQPLSIENILE